MALGQCSESSLLFGKSERVFCLYNELKFHFMTTYSLMTAARARVQAVRVLQCCSACVWSINPGEGQYAHCAVLCLQKCCKIEEKSHVPAVLVMSEHSVHHALVRFSGNVKSAHLLKNVDICIYIFVICSTTCSSQQQTMTHHHPWWRASQPRLQPQCFVRSQISHQPPNLSLPSFYRNPVH